MAPLRLVRRHPLAAVVLLAVLVRVVFFLLYAAGRGDPINLGGGDGTEYWALGDQLTHSLSFTNPLFLFRPPGFPLLIALELLVWPGGSHWVPVVGNMALSVAIVPLTYVLARSLGLSRRTGLIAALIMAVEPTTSLWGATVLSEPLQTVFSIAAIIFALRSVRNPERAFRYAALAGVATALALLVKPAALLLVPILAVMLLAGLWKALGARSLVAAVLIVGMAAVPYVAWRSENKSNFGVAAYSTMGNHQLYFVRAVSVLRRATGKPAHQIERELADRLSRQLGVQPSPARDLYYYRATTDKRAIDKMGADARQIFLDHPFWFFAVYPISTVKLFFSSSIDVPTPLYVAILAAIYAMAFVGLRRLWGGRNRLAVWTIAAVVGSVVLLTTTEHGSPNTRYLVPVMPLIAIAAAAALRPAPGRTEPGGSPVAS